MLLCYTYMLWNLCISVKTTESNSGWSQYKHVFRWWRNCLRKVKAQLSGLQVFETNMLTNILVYIDLWRVRREAKIDVPWSYGTFRLANQPVPKILYVNRGCCRLVERLDIFHCADGCINPVNPKSRSKYAVFKSALSGAVLAYNRKDLELFNKAVRAKSVSKSISDEDVVRLYIFKEQQKHVHVSTGPLRNWKVWLGWMRVEWDSSKQIV